MSVRIWTVMLLLLCTALTVAAQRRSMPVKVEFEPPPAMQAGETTTTRLVFHALTDVERLQVTVSPVNGVQIVSEQKHVEFANLRKGDTPYLDVTVRLAGAKFGSISVTYEADSNTGASADAFTIVYGDTGR